MTCREFIVNVLQWFCLILNEPFKLENVQNIKMCVLNDHPGECHIWFCSEFFFLFCFPLVLLLCLCSTISREDWLMVSSSIRSFRVFPISFFSSGNAEVQQEFRRHCWTGRSPGHDAWYHQISKWFHAPDSNHRIWGNCCSCSYSGLEPSHVPVTTAHAVPMAGTCATFLKDVTSVVITKNISEHTCHVEVGCESGDILGEMQDFWVIAPKTHL